MHGEIDPGIDQPANGPTKALREQPDGLSTEFQGQTPPASMLMPKAQRDH